MNGERKAATIFSVGGGKGGVGKSILSIALGTALAKQGKSVVLIDLDLGAANLHTYLGILKQTQTIADFLTNKASTLDELILETSVRNLGFISGAEFVPGITNPAHWMKMKLIRHVRVLPADYVIIDLGAGVHFNTLDFFGISDRGIVITAPEPGAVMNAYGFIKGALYRKMQNVFKNHPDVAKVIEAETKNTNAQKAFTLEWFRETLGSVAPDVLPLISEIEQSYHPALVINRAPEGQTHLLVKNLISLCKERLDISLEHVGGLPEARDMSNHLLNVPRFFNLPDGASYYDAVKRIVSHLVDASAVEAAKPSALFDFTDEEQEQILQLIESLDERVFTAATRNMWKLRLFFKPADVITFLVSRGVTHPLFYKSA